MKFTIIYLIMKTQNTEHKTRLFDRLTVRLNSTEVSLNPLNIIEYRYIRSGKKLLHLPVYYNNRAWLLLKVKYY